MPRIQSHREKPYPTDASDEEWAFAALDLCLLPEGAPQRRHDLREVYNALKWIVRAGAPWHLLPRPLALADRPPAGDALAGGRRVQGHCPPGFTHEIAAVDQPAYMNLL